MFVLGVFYWAGKLRFGRIGGPTTGRTNVQQPTVDRRTGSGQLPRQKDRFQTERREEEKSCPTTEGRDVRPKTEERGGARRSNSKKKGRRKTKKKKDRTYTDKERKIGRKMKKSERRLTKETEDERQQKK